MPFTFQATALPDVIRVIPRRFSDERGWFAELHKVSDFAAAGIASAFVQDNESLSAQGTVRGLHYQLPPYSQGKLIRIVAGRVWDVAVDIRRSSPSFGCWVSIELSAENGEMVWIPPGFAHGFVALEDGTHMVYKCTAEYHAASERSILWNDPDIGIVWPVLAAGFEYRLSARDSAAIPFRTAELFP